MLIGLLCVFAYEPKKQVKKIEVTRMRQVSDSPHYEDQQKKCTFSSDSFKIFRNVVVT